MDGETVTAAGYGTTFEWGYNEWYELGALDSEENFQEKSTIYSTCMTTEESPLDARFQHCDTQWVSKKEFPQIVLQVKIPILLPKKILIFHSFSYIGSRNENGS